MSTMANYSAKGGPSNGSVYICNLPPGTDEDMLAEYFGTIGLLKKDKRTGRPKIWLYRDKVTDEPKGDATVTYEDPHAAVAAVEWFNNKEFHGNIIEVLIAQSKNSHNSIAPFGDPILASGVGANESDPDINGSGARGRGRGDASGNIPQKAWQQDGDWMCPNTSCTNVNFAFRGVCNRCGTARPAGAGGGGAGGGGRGRGRGGSDMGGGRGGVGGSTGLFGPNDWSCPMCANINWAKRLKCNICNTNKPGVSEGGVRGGRAGGYKELDEEELEETKRRRREAEEDDGEMYDEFGNLKKKFRVKAQQAEVGQVLPGTGRAGWEVEELEEKEAETGGRKEKAVRTDVGAEVMRGIGVGKETGITVMKERESMVGIGTVTVTGIIIDYKINKIYVCLKGYLDINFFWVLHLLCEGLLCCQSFLNKSCRILFANIYELNYFNFKMDSCKLHVYVV